MRRETASGRLGSASTDGYLLSSYRHHFISHPAKKEGIGPVEVLDRVAMQIFVREHCTVIAAPVQCDVDGIPEGSHYVRVPIAIGRPNARDSAAGRSPSAAIP